jgi:hypothetical protein
MSGATPPVLGITSRDDHGQLYFLNLLDGSEQAASRLGRFVPAKEAPANISSDVGGFDNRCGRGGGTNITIPTGN